MKFFAIGSIAKPMTPEQRQEIMPKEVPDTLSLYLEGTIEQFWFRQDTPGVVFLVSAESADQAKAALDKLPLTTAGFMTFDMFPVGPLAPLRLLLPAK